MNNKEILFTTHCKTKVFKHTYYRNNSEINEQLLIMVLKEYSEQIDEAYTEESMCILTYNFHHVVGVSFCVECPLKSDNVYFKRRNNRPYLSRMVMGTLPEPTTYGTVVLKYVKGGMAVVSSWYGKKAYTELGCIKQFEYDFNPLKSIAKSAQFWTTHALIDNNPSPKQLYEDIILIAQKQGRQLPITISVFNELLSKRLGLNNVLLIPEEFQGDKDRILVELKNILNKRFNQKRI